MSGGVTNHNELFSKAQDNYFKTGKDFYLTEIYNIVFDLAKNYIAKYGRTKKVYIQDVETKAHDVATFIIERKFLKRKGKVIEKITSYIYYDCLHQIVSNKEYDRINKNGNKKILL